MPRADKRAAVRALFVSHDLTVSRMMQVAFGEIALTKEMPRARSIPLKPVQIASLYALAQLTMPVNPARPVRSPRRGRHGPREDDQEITTLTAQEARASTRARGPARAGAKPHTETTAVRGPQQRAALRRGKGGGSNRASRPAPAGTKR